MPNLWRSFIVPTVFQTSLFNLRAGASDTQAHNFEIWLGGLPASLVPSKKQNPESGEWLRTCTIITGEPNELVAQIHPRMPVILPEQHHAAWLGETDDGNLKRCCSPTLPTRCECGKFLRG